MFTLPINLCTALPDTIKTPSSILIVHSSSFSSNVYTFLSSISTNSSFGNVFSNSDTWSINSSTPCFVTADILNNSTLSFLAKWQIKKENGVFIVTGKPIQKLIGRINIDDNESFYYLQKNLREMGVDSKLREMGVCDGDTVILEDWEFEWED